MERKNMGCFVPAIVFLMYVGLFFLSKVPKESQVIVGTIGAAIFVIVLVFLRVKHGRPLRY